MTGSAEPPDRSMENSKKRKLGTETKTARRALSCTECKRRKSKCSAIGKTPCDACVYRGTPHACRWEGLPSNHEETRSGHSTFDSNDVNALREQIDRLERIISSQWPPSSVSQSPHAVQNLERAVPSTERITFNVESAASRLEHAVVGNNDRPSTIIPSEIAHDGPNHTAKSFNLLSLFGSPLFDQASLSVLPLLLPNSPLGRQLAIDFLDGPIQKAWHILSRLSFEKHLDVYCAMTTETFDSKLDPVWLATYLMALVFAVKFPDPNRSDAVASLRSLCPNLEDTLQDASVKALGSSDYLVRPQIGHIQVSIMLVIFLFHFGKSAENVNLALRHLDSAITTALWLKLDIQGPSSNALLSEDSHISNVPPALRMELSKQLYHLLTFLNGTMNSLRGSWKLPRASLSSLPHNLNEVDLIGDTVPAEYPDTQKTEASLSRLGSAFADIIRSLPILGDSGEMTPAQVHTFDARCQKLISSFPSLPNDRDSWMLSLLRASIHNRLVRVHRPFILRGYREEDWRFSTKSCLSSAERILALRQDFICFPQQLRPTFFDRWTLGAVIVLAVDHIEGFDDGRNSLANIQDTIAGERPEMAEAIRTLVEAAKAFQQKTTKPRDVRGVEQFFESVMSTTVRHDTGGSDSGLATWMDSIIGGDDLANFDFGLLDFEFSFSDSGPVNDADTGQFRVDT